MASCDSLDNTNKLKIAGIGEDPQKGYLKNLNEKYQISDHYDILKRFKSFEYDEWGKSGPDTETRAFIDTLLFIIHNEIRYPSGKILENSETEITNANQLVKEVEDTIKETKDDEKEEKIGKTMKKLENFFTKIGKKQTFNNFVCCLLMSELEPKLPKSSNDEQVEIKANLFTGVFQSWNLLKKLSQVKVTQLEGILFNEKNKKPKIESIVNRKRAKQIERGFHKMIKLINESKNIPIKELDRFCKKEEAIQNSFYKWFIDSNRERIIKITDFTSCYVSLKCEHLPKFDEYTNLKKNFINYLQWEIKEINDLLPPTSTTENIVSNLQVQLVDLWKQVKDNVNDVEEWNPLVMENSNKGTLQRNEVPCSLDKLKCLQINLNRSEKAWNRVVGKWLKDDRVHIVFIQEPCIKKMEITRQNVKETNKKNYFYYFPNLPTNYRTIHNNYLIYQDQELANDDEAKSKSGERIYISAILVHKDVSFERILPMAAIHDKYNYPQELMAGIRLTGQGWNGVTLFSIYCRPIRSLTMVLKPLLFDNHNITRTVLCMDANATHPNWSPAHENKGLYLGRGEDLENFRTSCNLEVANQNFEKGNNQPTRDDKKNKKERKSKHIDVTFYRGDLLCTKEKEDRWKRLEDETKSDHRYITFSIRNYSEDAKKSSLNVPSCFGRNKVSARSPDAEV